MPLFFAFVTFAAIIIYIGFVVYIIQNNVRSRSNQLLLGIIAMLLVWGISEMIMRLPVSENTALDAYRWGAAVYNFTGIIFLYYILSLTGSRLLSSRLLLALFVIPVIIVSYLNFTTDLITNGVEYYSFGYVASPGSLRSLMVVDIDIFFIAGFAIALRFYKRSKIYIEKKRALLVVVGTAIPLIIGSITDGLLPVMGYQVPRSVVTTSVAMVAFFTYANIRYGLINPTPAMAAKSMANAMSDSLILLSPKFTIELVNPATANLLGYMENELIDKPLGVLVGDKVSRQLQRAVINQEDLSRVELAYKPKTGNIIPMKLSFSTLEDKKGRGLLGVVIIGREARQEQAIIEGLNQEIRDSESEIKKLEQRRDNYEKKLIAMGLIDTGFDKGDERIKY